MEKSVLSTIKKWTEELSRNNFFLQFYFCLFHPWLLLNFTVYKTFYTATHFIVDKKVYREGHFSYIYCQPPGIINDYMQCMKCLVYNNESINKNIK